MLPSRHIIASLPLGIAVGYFTQSLFAGILCFLSGTLIDIDHLIEYMIHFGSKNLRPKAVYWTCIKMASLEEGRVERIYLFLHAGEIAIFLWIGFAFTRNILLLSIALGYTMHLILDSTANIVKPSGYFMISRIMNNFRKTKFIRHR